MFTFVRFDVWPKTPPANRLEEAEEVLYVQVIFMLPAAGKEFNK